MFTGENMPTFTWEDRYSIGIEEIDAHHRHLFALLNKAHGDFLEHKPPSELKTIIDELIDYATYHFSAEERRMPEIAYSGAANHKREHTEFILRVVQMHADYQNRKLYFLEILAFLHEWLKNHILQTDAEFGGLLKAAAMKPNRTREGA
jgi:hemerythrin